MRGHWISTTRKLNKHYQSSQNNGGHGPIDPTQPVFGLFACAAYVFPYYFRHRNGVGNNYYDSGYSYSPNVSSSYIDNMVRMVRYRGWYWKYMGGCFQCGGKDSGIPEIDNNGLKYGGKDLGAYTPIADAGNSDFYNTALTPIDTGIMFKDYGYRYAKISIPQYNFGPAYYTNVEAQLPSVGTFFTENVHERLAPQPVYNGIVLDADEITTLSALRGNQRINLTEEYIDRNGNPASRSITFINGAASQYNLSDIKNNNVTYLEKSITIYRNGRQADGSLTVTARLYEFLYNNEFYFSTTPELYYQGQLLDPHDNIYVSKQYFPSGLGGYPKRGAFENTDCPGFWRWVEYSYGSDPASLQSEFFGMQSNISYLGPMDDGYIYNPHSIAPFARIETVSDSKWQQALANAWT